MTGRMLIGADGSSRAADAMALGTLLAPVLEAEPTLLHAHPYGDLERLLPEGECERLIQEVVETSSRQAQAHFGTATPPPLLLSASRSPAAALHAAALEAEVAAIIIGSSHRSPIGRVIPGGVAQRLLSGAPCPVVVAPAGFAARQPLDLGTIGAAFDGSSEAASALRTAADLARANRGPLAVIAVHERIAFGHLPVAADRAFVSANQQLRSDLADRLDEAVAALEMGDQATGTLYEGDAATVLADESENLGLLVVGSRGYGPVRSVLLGSVSSRLLSRSACPVMVVPREAHEDRLAPDGRT